MLKPVPQVAEELCVSKTAIYNKLKLKEYKKLVVKKEGISMIDETLFNLIKESLKVKSPVENEKKESISDEELAIDKDGLINLNKELIATLLEQLKQKDIQIGELHKLIENNQVLLKEEQKHKNNNLQLEEHFATVDLKLQQLQDKMELKKTKKRNFSFFGK